MKYSSKQLKWIVIASSLAMILLGATAIMLPSVAGLSVALFLGLLVVTGGVAHLAYALAAWGMGEFLWRSLVGVIYSAAGLYLIFHPKTSLELLTWFLAALLCIEGFLEIGISIFTIDVAGSLWLLMDGILTIFISILIWSNWPASASWAIGAMLGINLILGGVTRLSYAAIARRSSVVVV